MEHKQSWKELRETWAGERYPERKGVLRGGSRDAWASVPGWKKQLKARGGENRNPGS